MSGDAHVQFWESLGVRFPGATDAGYSEFGLAMGVARYRRYTKSCP